MKNIFYLLICLFVFSAYIEHAVAIQKSQEDPLVTLQNTDISDLTKKSVAIKKIRRGKDSLTVAEKNKILDLFEKESNRRKEFVDVLVRQGHSKSSAVNEFNSTHRTKGYVHYYANLASLASDLKDKRAVIPLLRGIVDYGGPVSPMNVINVGEEAVEPLLTAIKSKDYDLEKTALQVLSIWVHAPVQFDDYNINEAAAIKNPRLLEKVKLAFIEALQDKDIDIRSRAVYGLEAFPEDMIIKKLEAVSANDPYYSDYEKKYILREEANKAIEILKNKMKDKSVLK